jgi:hypothetical protein
MSIMKHTMMVMAAAGMMGMYGCSSVPKNKAQAYDAYQKGVPGGTTTQRIEQTIKVTGIDASTRQVTGIDGDGNARLLQVGQEVVNFDQIRLGDLIKTVVTEELAVHLRGKNEPSDDGLVSQVALAERGDKPSGSVVESFQATATVVGLDAARQEAKLQFEDGSTRVFPVRKDVDLTKRSIGEEVVIRRTQTVTIAVESLPAK